MHAWTGAYLVLQLLELLLLVLTSVLVCTGPSASEPFDVVTSTPDLREPSPSCYVDTSVFSMYEDQGSEPRVPELVLRVEAC